MQRNTSTRQVKRELLHLQRPNLVECAVLQHVCVRLARNERVLVPEVRCPLVICGCISPCVAHHETLHSVSDLDASEATNAELNMLWEACASVKVTRLLHCSRVGGAYARARLSDAVCKIVLALPGQRTFSAMLCSLFLWTRSSLCRKMAAASSGT